MADRVVLVDERDGEIGSADKLRAHAEGLLHRAFSVFLYNGRDELLLQRRARAKYHTGGLWSNTCCSHPRPGEDVGAAAVRRLEEEMGIRSALSPAFGFHYRARVGRLWEHEYDHVFVGHFEGEPRPDPAEVEEWRWWPIEDLRQALVQDPDTFTPWFRPAFEGLVQRGWIREPERI